MTADKFWTRVKTLARAHKISLENFAAYIGIPRSTFYSWSKYNRIPDILTAYAIAAALGVSMEYLVTGADGYAARKRMKQTESRKNAKIKMQKMVSKLQFEMEKL
jgi:transcriptional regulator with XRE-family HTH domain